MSIHSQDGGVLQLPVARQVTVADPDSWYPLLQWYSTVFPNGIVIGCPENPLATVTWEPQEKPCEKRHAIINLGYSKTCIRHLLFHVQLCATPSLHCLMEPSPTLTIL